VVAAGAEVDAAPVMATVAGVDDPGLMVNNTPAVYCPEEVIVAVLLPTESAALLPYA
jgi:hypothetical protein